MQTYLYSEDFSCRCTRAAQYVRPGARGTRAGRPRPARARPHQVLARVQRGLDGDDELRQHRQHLGAAGLQQVLHALQVLAHVTVPPRVSAPAGPPHPAGPPRPAGQCTTVPPGLSAAAGGRPEQAVLHDAGWAPMRAARRPLEQPAPRRASAEVRQQQSTCGPTPCWYSRLEHGRSYRCTPLSPEALACMALPLRTLSAQRIRLGGCKRGRGARRAGRGARPGRPGSGRAPASRGCRRRTGAGSGGSPACPGPPARARAGTRGARAAPVHRYL